jgi:potassium uptake TrkH family protein
LTEKRRKTLKTGLKVATGASAAIGLASFVADYGFWLSPEWTRLTYAIQAGVVATYVAYQLSMAALSRRPLKFARDHKIEFALVALIVAESIFAAFGAGFLARLGSAIGVDRFAPLSVVLVQSAMILGFATSAFRLNGKLLNSRVHPARVFVGGFAALVAVGTGLLTLPKAAVSGSIDFIDALFTATSAVCVTGLITVDTATRFTPLGKSIILALFQIGALGIMAFTTFVAIFLSGGLGIRQRKMLRNLLPIEQKRSAMKTLRRIVLVTFGAEALGAAVVFFGSRHAYPDDASALFSSVFHAVSAFCNAGFSLFSENLTNPVAVDNGWFTGAVAALIVLGGLGYPTVLSIVWFKRPSRRRGTRGRLSLQAKIVLTTTAALIVLGTLAFAALEWNGALANQSAGGKLYSALFQSITARTAGFNTVDIGAFGVAASLVMIALMFVGASPGGTGGGLKTTTAAIGWLGVWKYMRNGESVVAWGREIDPASIHDAMMKIALSVGALFLGVFALALFETAPLLDLVFEAFSAFATVGLSRGVTAELSVAGKLTIVALMFVGRVGVLAFAYTLVPSRPRVPYRLPTEQISTQ